MSQVTISDVRDITKLEEDEIQGWIEIQRSAILNSHLGDDRYIEAILDDYEKLIEERFRRSKVFPTTHNDTLYYKGKRKEM